MMWLQDEFVLIAVFGNAALNENEFRKRLNKKAKTKTVHNKSH